MTDTKERKEFRLRFFSDPDGQHELPVQIEGDPNDGWVTAWCQMPVLSATSDTTVYMRID